MIIKDPRSMEIYVAISGIICFQDKKTPSFLAKVFCHSSRIFLCSSGFFIIIPNCEAALLSKPETILT